MVSSSSLHEKDNAMRKFQGKQMLEYMFHFLNISATLFFLYRSSFFLPLFANSFYAFLLLNAIILFLYALPNSDAYKITAPKTVPNSTSSSPEKKHKQDDDDVCEEKVGDSSPIFEEKAVTETTTSNGEEKNSYRRVKPERRVVAGPERAQRRWVYYVDKLSKDEFNRAVEDFIAMHKRKQLEEEQIQIQSIPQSKQSISLSLNQIRVGD